MRAKELVPILAEEWGIPLETADVIDRALADAGLREKGRGRDVPEMTRREAVVFLLACMVAGKPTKAGQEVQPWLDAKGRITDTPDEADAKPDPVAGVVGPQVHSRLLHEMLPDLDLVPYHGGDPDNPISLTDLLVAICDRLANGPMLYDEIRLEISLSQGWAACTMRELDTGKRSEIRFGGNGDGPGAEFRICRSAVVSKFALSSIASRTGAAD